MIKIYGYITIIFCILASSVYSQDIGMLEDIDKETRIHNKMIKTGKGKIFHFSQTYPNKEPVKKIAEWIYKNEYWRIDYDGTLWNSSCRSKASENVNYRSGLYFTGITGYNIWGDGISYLVENMLEKGNGKFDSVKEENFKGKKCQSLYFTVFDENKKPKYSTKIVVSPSQQYSYLYYEFSKYDTGEIVQISEINMEYIEPAGIWFPKQAVFSRNPDPENPDEFRTVDKFVFKDTELNIPVADEEFAIDKSNGSVRNNLDNKEISQVDIITNIANNVIKNIQKSMILKSMVMGLLFLVISFTLIQFSKKKNKS
jgi:hypothetical protein